MTAQLSLFADPATRPSGLCPYDVHCGGLMIDDGPARVTATCRTVPIRCLTCDRTGVESDNLTLKE